MGPTSVLTASLVLLMGPVVFVCAVPLASSDSKIISSQVGFDSQFVNTYVCPVPPQTITLPGSTNRATVDLTHIMCGVIDTKNRLSGMHCINRHEPEYKEATVNNVASSEALAALNFMNGNAKMPVSGFYNVEFLGAQGNAGLYRRIYMGGLKGGPYGWGPDHASQVKSILAVMANGSTIPKSANAPASGYYMNWPINECVPDQLANRLTKCLFEIPQAQRVKPAFDGIASITIKVGPGAGEEYCLTYQQDSTATLKVITSAYLTCFAACGDIKCERKTGAAANLKEGGGFCDFR